MLMSSLLRGLVFQRASTLYRAPICPLRPYQPVSDGQTYGAIEDSRGSSPSVFPLPVASFRLGCPWACQLRFRPRRYQRRRVAWEHRLNTSRSISLMVLSHMRPHVTQCAVYAWEAVRVAQVQFFRPVFPGPLLAESLIFPGMKGCTTRFSLRGQNLG